MGTVPAAGHVKQESEVYRTATTWYAAVEMVRSEWKSHNFGKCVNHLHAKHKSLKEQIVFDTFYSATSFKHSPRPQAFPPSHVRQNYAQYANRLESNIRIEPLISQTDQRREYNRRASHFHPSNQTRLHPPQERAHRVPIKQLLESPLIQTNKYTTGCIQRHQAREIPYLMPRPHPMASSHKSQKVERGIVESKSKGEWHVYREMQENSVVISAGEIAHASMYISSRPSRKHERQPPQAKRRDS